MLCSLAAALLAAAAVYQAHPADVGEGSYASPEQRTTWMETHAHDRVVMVSDARENPVRRRDRLPKSWLNREGIGLSQFDGKARPGEFFVFQVSLFNNGVTPIHIRTVDITSFPSTAHPVCLNLAVAASGSDSIEVKPGWIQPLWIGLEAEDAGTVDGKVKIQSALGESGEFVDSVATIHVDVSGQPLPNHGLDEGWRLARLKWLLPSSIGEGTAPTKGFSPVQRTGNQVHLTSVTVQVGKDGLPQQISSATGSKLLSQPARLVLDSKNNPVKWHQSPARFTEEGADHSTWISDWDSESCSLQLAGVASFDGFLKYRIRLSAKSYLDLTDVRLEIPYLASAAEYQLGLGYRGGYTPDHSDWKWNVAFQQDCVWIGNPSVGTQLRLKGGNYERPLVNIYYGYRPLNLPDSWGNHGLGGVKVHPVAGSERLLQAYSGPRIMRKGEVLEFNFDLQLTPSRPINTEAQWSTRYYHPGGGAGSLSNEDIVGTATKAGANVINVHQSLPINPFINYPFNDFSVPDLARFTKLAHDEKIRVKAYYTTRELTWQLPEFWALASFGDSIIEPGPGPKAKTVINPNGAHPTLTEALGDNFIPAWTNDLDGKYKGQIDLSVITKPDSPWTEYYLNGLDWLSKNIGVDGVYIDDTALDRASLLRARRILESNRPSPLIDLHSWNHEDPLAARGSSTSIYMELFPYIDRIWFGEGFDYASATPDYWLVAMSGIPYGVMSEMLQGGGNVWRGMLFGETCRLGWSGDPTSMWRFWDQFGMAGSKMIGWWDANCPVKTGSKQVLATVYRSKHKVLIAVANWTKNELSANLKINWKELGIDSSRASAISPAIEGFQPNHTWDLDKPIPVPGGQGWLIVLRGVKH